jgi:hypothetical protein
MIRITSLSLLYLVSLMIVRERQRLMVGLPDLWVDGDDEVGQLGSDDQIPGYVEYPDRMSLHALIVC